MQENAGQSQVNVSGRVQSPWGIQGNAKGMYESSCNVPGEGRGMHRNARGMYGSVSKVPVQSMGMPGERK